MINTVNTSYHFKKDWGKTRERISFNTTRGCVPKKKALKCNEDLSMCPYLGSLYTETFSEVPMGPDEDPNWPGGDAVLTTAREALKGGPGKWRDLIYVLRRDCVATGWRRGPQGWEPSDRLARKSPQLSGLEMLVAWMEASAVAVREGRTCWIVPRFEGEANRTCQIEHGVWGQGEAVVILGSWSGVENRKEE